MWVFGKANVNNAMFIIYRCSGSTKNLFNFGSMLSAGKVVMNENVNFISFQFISIPKNKVAFQKIAIFASFLSLTPYSLSVSLAWWNLVFSSKPWKIFNLFWRPKYSKLTKICLIWILVQTVFFVHAKFEHNLITERA